MSGRLPRHVVPGKLHEVTFRCHQARPLLRPSTKLNRVLIGCLGMAQRVTGIEVVWLTAMSNHGHALVVPESHTQLSDFLCHFKGNLSKETGRLHGYEGGIFAGVRTDVAPVTDEPEAQLARLEYLLSQGVKEGLCPSPWHWPGVQFAQAIRKRKLILEGGIWVHRTAMFHRRQAWDRRQRAKSLLAKARGPRFEPREAHFREDVSVAIAKLPCWREMSDHDYCQAVCDLMDSIVRNHQEKIQRLPTTWRRRILERSPTQRPAKIKRTPRVLVHAASREERLAFREMLKAWLQQYRVASERLRAGCLEAISDFPANSFPPTLPGTIVANN